MEEKEKVIVAQGMGICYDFSQKKDDFQSLIFNLSFRKKEEAFWALKDITFSAYAGELLGIIGGNGAGKTTLCKVISGIIQPDHGDIQVGAKVSALLSMGTGFDSRLSGKDNIYLNGMMLGMTKKKVKEFYNEIYEFSGIGQFIHEPVKNYSSGMKARLGFSVAAMLNPEILVLDEALSTGDLEFQGRASEKVKELIKTARMVIVVSHNSDFIEENCTRAIWINQGKIEAEGDPVEVSRRYKESVPESSKKKKKVLNLTETKANIKENVVLKASNIGVKFKVGKKDFWSLKGVSFSVKEGEIVGIIGHNGAGKSTLCRAISGIYKPDEGRIRALGKTTALLSLGTGFNRQLSGRDNIRLTGMMMGISKKKIDQVQDQVIEFSGLNSHIDKPIKDYSSGMKAKLGFSIAAVLEPELFIIDEALTAGDMAFKEKASERIQKMIHTAKAVMVVTHNTNFVENVCTRALWFEKGHLVFDGDPKEAVKRYKESTKKNKKREKLKQSEFKTTEAGKKFWKGYNNNVYSDIS